RQRGFGFEERKRALLALGPDSEALLQKEDRTGLEMILIHRCCDALSDEGCGKAKKGLNSANYCHRRSETIDSAGLALCAAKMGGKR
ncbi:hypothetical protein AVEN_246727-1, partial [Araneus ventricosus]